MVVVGESKWSSLKKRAARPRIKFFVFHFFGRTRIKLKTLALAPFYLFIFNYYYQMNPNFI